MLILCVCFFHFSSFCQQTLVNGQISGKDIDTLYLFQFQKTDWEYMDTAVVKGGHFQFQVDVAQRGMYKVGALKTSSSFVILGEESLQLKVDAAKDPVGLHISDSPENDHLQEYLNFLKELRQEVLALQKELPNVPGSAAQGEGLQEASNAINQHVEKRKQNFFSDMSHRRPATLITKLAAFNLFDTGAPLKNYFNKDDFQDEELTSVLFYEGKLHSYLIRSSFQDSHQLQIEINRLIDLTPAASPARETLIISAIRLLKNYTELVSALARRYQMEFPESKIAQQLVAVLPQPGPQVGELAPDISLSDSTGRPLSLSSLRGQYVLLDFWASWCRPCRLEAPRVVKAFHKFKDRGFTIYGVSLDSRRDMWLQAIEKDGLQWHHVSDLKGWKSEGAAQYGIRSIPATYLIDPQGKIIARNLRGAALSQVLAETFSTRE